MQISVQQFSDAIKRVSSILKEKGVLDTDDKIFFDEGGVFAASGGSFVFIPLQCEFRCCVNGVELAAYCLKLSGGDIDVNLKDNALSIAQGRSSARFELFDCVLESPRCEGDGQKLPSRFFESLSLAAQGCGNDYSDMRTMVIHCSGEIVEATDEQRIIRCSLEKAIKGDFIIPFSFISVLGMFEPCYLYDMSDWVLFKDENEAICGHRKISLQSLYPDLGEVLNNCSGGQLVKFPEKMYDAVNKAAVFQARIRFENERKISVKCKNGRLRIESKGGSGSFCEVLPIDCDSNFSFVINPAFLQNMMEKSVSIKVAKEYMRIESDNYVYLTSLEV